MVACFISKDWTDKLFAPLQTQSVFMRYKMVKVECFHGKCIHTLMIKMRFSNIDHPNNDYPEKDKNDLNRKL